MAKRAATGSGSGISPRGDLEDIQSHLEEFIKKEFDQRDEKQRIATKAANDTLSTNITGMVVQHVGALGKRVDKVEKAQKDTETRLLHLEHENNERFLRIEADNKRLAAQLQVAQSTEVTQKQINQSDFARMEDPTILRLWCRSPTNAELVRPVVVQWLTAAGFNENQWKLSGSGQKYKVQFLGTCGLAGTNAKHANLSLQNDDDSWQKLMVPIPNAALSQLYVGPDKSDQRILLEKMGKRMVHAIKSMGKTGDLPVSATRPDDGESIIFIDGVVIAKLVAPSRAEAKAAYDNDAMATHGIARELLMEAFDSLAPPSLSSKVGAANLSF